MNSVTEAPRYVSCCSTWLGHELLTAQAVSQDGHNGPDTGLPRLVRVFYPLATGLSIPISYVVPISAGRCTGAWSGDKSVVGMALDPLWAARTNSAGRLVATLK
jgi:hypothetical protein